MNFATALQNESRKTFTENGATAYNTTSNACLDLFGTIGSLRDRDDVEVERLFAEAFTEDKLLATRILFYARDIRGGLGERRVFRLLIKYLAKYHQEAILPNLDLIGVYGRYDDMYELIDTPVEDAMWVAMKTQFEEDVANYNEGKAVSMLAKWIKTPDASSEKTRRLGIKTANKLGYSVYDFKRILRKLRKHIDIVERYMSAGEWDKIQYSAVPSRAMMIYRKAFGKHDSEGFEKFLEKALTGEVKINSSALYPYDMVSKVRSGEDSDVLEAQWRQLPDYVEKGVNAIVMADVSGSMTCSGGRPFNTSIGLAMYFAERNEGAFHNLFMTFSSNPKVVQLKGERLAQKVQFLSHAEWGGSTDLEKAFMLVLDIAERNHISPEEMVKSIIVVSDMEINFALGAYVRGHNDWLFYDSMRRLYEEKGYDIPNVVFWNVNSRNDVFHADANRKGVQLCSGQSAATFKQLMGCIGMTPVEMMLSVINSERYEAVSVQE